MRRGLISRSPGELPDAVLEARLGRLRAAMANAGFDALLIYTNNTRPAGVSWVAGFVPYWSEALLVVTHTRAPVLVAALSARVKRWIEATSRLDEVVHTPRIGREAARLIAGMAASANVGVVELDQLPSGIADDLREGGPNLAVSDASAPFARVRSRADPAEIALAHHAATIAHRALASASFGDGDVGRTVASVDGEARRLGAEEVYVAVAPDLDRSRRMIRIEGDVVLGQRFALRASVAYRGTWVRMVRTVLQGDPTPGILAAANAQLANAVAQLPSDRGLSELASWLVEGSRLTQPLDSLLGSRVASPTPPAAGALVSVQAGVEIDGIPVLVGGPALTGAEQEASSLLMQPVFD